MATKLGHGAEQGFPARIAELASYRSRRRPSGAPPALGLWAARAGQADDACLGPAELLRARPGDCVVGQIAESAEPRAGFRLGLARTLGKLRDRGPCAEALAHALLFLLGPPGVGVRVCAPLLRNRVSAAVAWCPVDGGEAAKDGLDCRTWAATARPSGGILAAEVTDQLAIVVAATEVPSEAFIGGRRGGHLIDAADAADL